MMIPKPWKKMMIPSNEMLILRMPQQEERLARMSEKIEIQEFQMVLAQSKT